MSLNALPAFAFVRDPSLHNNLAETSPKLVLHVLVSVPSSALLDSSGIGLRCPRWDYGGAQGVHVGIGLNSL